MLRGIWQWFWAGGGAAEAPVVPVRTATIVGKDRSRVTLAGADTSAVPLIGRDRSQVTLTGTAEE